MTLPRFTEHDEHDKLRPLTAPVEPNPAFARYLERIGRDRESFRVLDLGCGRGGTVAWLLEQGWDAYGMDVDKRYVDNGVGLVGRDRLAVLTGDEYPYPAHYFDAVISDQVLEHVADIDHLAREVARVTAHGGGGLHIFPAKWIYREPHMLTPPVHWLPKGRARRAAITAMLRAGRAAPLFADRPLAERAAIFSTYSDEETFYRPLRRIRVAFEQAGLVTDVRRPSVDQVQVKLGRPLPPVVADLAGLAYRATRLGIVETTRL